MGAFLVALIALLAAIGAAWFCPAAEDRRQRLDPRYRDPTI
jgi:hypothetical protein